MREKVFYKYREVNEYTINSIKNKYHYFSTPYQLNDPEDCRPQIVDNLLSYSNNDFEKLRNSLIIRIIKEKRLSPFNRKKAINILKNECLWCNEDLKVHFSKEEIVRINSILSTINHVLCLTNNSNSDYIWKNYANEYSGVCIGYKTICVNDEYFLYVYRSDLVGLLDLSNQYKGINNSSGIKELPLIEVLYNREIEKLNLCDFLEQNEKWKRVINDSALCKTIDYKSESEYRVLLAGDRTDCKIHHPDQALHSITFGKNCSKENKDHIKRIIKRHYINTEAVEILEL